MAPPPRPAAQSKSARHQAGLREHYRAHRIQRDDGVWVNPLLDDANHPENIRHWTHGTVDGYSQAGCGCNRCASAKRAENDRLAQVAVDRRAAEHRARVTATLCAVLPSVDAQAAAAGAELVVSTHRVRNRKRAILDYQQVPVELAIKAWASEYSIALDAALDATAVATAVIEELQS
jgi:hypothetical protein